MTVILPREVPAMTTTSSVPEIYCVKCRSHTPSRGIEVVTMKNGRQGTRATCMVCGTKKFRMGAIG